MPDLLTIVPSLVRPIHPVQDMIALAALDRNLSPHPPGHRPYAQRQGRNFGPSGRPPRLGSDNHPHHSRAVLRRRFKGPLANAVFLAAERRAGAVTTHFVSVADAMTRQYVAAGIGRPGKLHPDFQRL